MDYQWWVCFIFKSIIYGNQEISCIQKIVALWYFLWKLVIKYIFQKQQKLFYMLSWNWQSFVVNWQSFNEPQMYASKASRSCTDRCPVPIDVCMTSSSNSFGNMDCSKWWISNEQKGSSYSLRGLVSVDWHLYIRTPPTHYYHHYHLAHS